MNKVLLILITLKLKCTGCCRTSLFILFLHNCLQGVSCFAAMDENRPCKIQNMAMTFYILRGAQEGNYLFLNYLRCSAPPPPPQLNLYMLLISIACPSRSLTYSKYYHYLNIFQNCLTLEQHR